MAYEQRRRYGPRKSRGAEIPVDQGSSQTYRIPKFAVGCFGLDSVLLAEGSIVRDVGINTLIIIRGTPLKPFGGGGR
jgi:hypothetical protein